MRILRVAQNLYPEVPGGGTYHVHAMSRDQVAMGHDVTILTVSDDSSLPRREERHGYTVVRRAPTVELLGNEISAGVAKFLRSVERFDVVHAHSHLYFSTNLAALKRQFESVPLAVTNHGLYSQNAPEWLFDLYLRTVGRWTFNRADAVFCYTPEDRRRVREFGVDSRVEVVANGVDTERFTPAGERSERIDHDGPVVLFVGRLVDGKRPQDAIRAVSQLRERRNVKLYVVGDGPLRSELAAMASDSVEFLGRVPYDEMPRIYRSGDVLVLPSRAEGLPRTVLEAFASGVPVVASDLEQVTPVVRNGGETVPVGDVAGYTDAIDRVLEKRNQLGQSSRDTVVSEFTWDETVEATTEHLRSLA